MFCIIYLYGNFYIVIKVFENIIPRSQIKSSNTQLISFHSYVTHAFTTLLSHNEYNISLYDTISFLKLKNYEFDLKTYIGRFEYLRIQLLYVV